MGRWVVRVSGGESQYKSIYRCKKDGATERGVGCGCG